MIYLDNASTTMLAPEVLTAMLPYMTEQYGNPGTIHTLGKQAKSAVDKARGQVAEFLGTTPEHIIFTSGGSEANNLALTGILNPLKLADKRHIILSATEHTSLMNAALSAATNGFDVTLVYPGNDGLISPDTIANEIRPNTGLVSIMYVNNETGFTNDIAAIGKICRAAGVLFHSDCVQAAGQCKLDMDELCLDMASISSHKIHGPKGMGALYFKDIVFDPLICGGDEQEFGFRGGTENVPGIVGFGAACEIAAKELNDTVLAVTRAKQEFIHALMEQEGANLRDAGIFLNGSSYFLPGKVLNLRIDGVSAETLVLMLDTSGVCVSAGSACNSRESMPSHVLKAHGLTDEQARSSIRVSFSKYNTDEQMHQAASVLAGCIAALRSTI